jgi:hypothetical protein
MLNCKEVTQLCSQELDRKLSLLERMSLRTHLMMCTGCSNFRKQMSSIHTVSRLYTEGKAISTAEPSSNQDN